jgi:hypothetical protein
MWCQAGYGTLKDVMRVLALLAVVIAAGVGSAMSSAAGEARPVLRLVDSSPVTFRGAGFEAYEHVRVVLAEKTRTVRRVVASAEGRFLVRFPGADANECTGFSAVAVGDRGSRATYKRAPGQCPQP